MLTYYYCYKQNQRKTVYEWNVTKQNRVGYLSVINCCRMVFLSGKHEALLSLILLPCEGGVFLQLDLNPTEQ